jgi:type VI secretion system secreted protein VgrG
MASSPKQGKRRAEFHSDTLGKDKLALTRFDGREAISDLFEYQVECLSEDRNIDFSKALGTPSSVRINTQDGKARYFHGVLTDAQWRGKQSDLYAYAVTLRPAFWLLSKKSTSRIFHKKTVADIIRTVISDSGIAADFNLGGYPQIEYCVQYCESDFSFVSRLMEEYGIYYYFDHRESEHTLMFVDSRSAHQDKFCGAKLPFFARDDKNFQETESLNEWTGSRRYSSGKFSVSDYNYMTPTADMLAEKQDGSIQHSGKSAEVYHYPGRFEAKGEGEKLANVRLEAEQAYDNRCDGAGDAVSCWPGRKMTLENNPQGNDGAEFLIVKCAHLYRAPAYASGSSDEDTYLGRYEFLPSDIQFRAPERAPKTRIFGPQTAVVVGDGEIDVDSDGRIEVQFHWAQALKQPKSRRVRISHGWSGASWGDIKIPRVGMEVVVEFLEGDPDQPLVTGCVYNSDNKPPYDLPGEKTKSGIKSKTDGGSGYNEFIFDDKSGDELVRLHAERDMEGKIKNDERRDIGNNVKIDVGVDRTEKIGSAWKVEAGSKIEFICGQSKIEMTPGSITIKSVKIDVEATASISEKATLSEYKASGIMTIQGGLVKIN